MLARNMATWLEHNGKRHEVRGVFSIGRLPENHLVLNEAKISRRHALIYAHAGRHWVVDFGSRNGVFINGQPVRHPMALVDKDELLMGDYRLRFVHDGPRANEIQPPETAPTPYAPTADAGAVFAAGGNSVMLLGPERNILSETDQARRWLDEYYGTAAVGTLPARVGAWLQHIQHGKAPTAIDPLIKQVEERRLVIRPSPASDGQWLLFLTEERPAYSVALLQTLGLTPREAEVMHWVAEGKTNPEIASILGISISTANKHLENILSKLEVNNRTQAMLRVLEKLGRG